MLILTIQILVILALVLINGFFAMAEISIFASRKAKLRQKSDEGSTNHRRVLDLTEKPGPFLSSMQVGITLIGILSGALGEQTLSSSMAQELREVDFLAPYANIVSLIVVVVGITVVSLIIGELVPKRIALSDPETMAARLVRPVRVVSMLFFPLERFLTGLTEIILRFLRVKDSEEPPVTEEELVVLLKEGRKAGVFQEVEQLVVENVLYLDDKGAHGYLTPRVDVVYLEKDAVPPEVSEVIVQNPGLSTIPVCDGGMDNVVGTVDGRKILAALATHSFTTLKDYLEPPFFMPETVSALRVLSVFKEKKVNIVFIIDEYGGVLGIMTIQNIIDRLFGAIVTHHDQTPQVLRRADGSFLVDGALPMSDFARTFDCEREWENERGEYHTVAGFILKRLGRIPAPGNYFVWKTFYFEVLDMDGNRIDTLLVRKFEKRPERPLIEISQTRKSSRS
ncbi:MAG: HlyC/CorC family transporter [Spirochaetales bacterium]|nr:HlyC/CorC family transporter [Spirochaetales bacterium]